MRNQQLAPPAILPHYQGVLDSREGLMLISHIKVGAGVFSFSNSSLAIGCRALLCDATMWSNAAYSADDGSADINNDFSFAGQYEVL